MKRLTRAVIVLLVTTFVPVLILFSFSAGGGHASALKPKPTPTTSPTATTSPTPTPCPTPSSGGTWTLTGSLLVARYGIFTATLLPNGQVLVAGGLQVYTGTLLAEAEVYSPSTGTWTLTGSLNIARSYHTATLLQGGQVLVVGGNSGTSGYTASAELYTP
jgi:Kelch motif